MKRKKKEKKGEKRKVRLKVCRREEPPSASSKQSTHLVIKVAGVSVTLSCSAALAPPKAASFPPFTLGYSKTNRSWSQHPKKLMTQSFCLF